MNVAFQLALALVVAAAGNAEVLRARVVAFKGHSADEATVVLAMLEPSNIFPGSCKTLRVHLRYGAEHWLLLGEPVFKREEHRIALNLLQQAQKSKTAIRLAVDSDAFGPIDDRGCEVQSNLLSTDEQQGGEPTFHSLYKWERDHDN